MNDPELTYYGSTKNGQIGLPKRMRREILTALPDCEIEVQVRRKRRRRSNNENNYYWGCIIPAFLAAFKDWDPETGWRSEMVHEVLKAKFLPLVRDWRQTVTPHGEVIDEPLTTTKLTTVEMELYLDYCRKWGAEMDILIALPNEQVEIFDTV